MTTRAGGVGGASMLLALLALAGCAAGDVCGLRPLDEPGGAGIGSASTAACPSLIEVDGRTYVETGSIPLTEAGVASLVPYDTVEAATPGVAESLALSSDRTVWSFPGGEPEWALWGTASYLHGTRNYLLWIAQDYPGHPYLCEVVDMAQLAEQVAESPDGAEMPSIVQSCS
jgi:hypothetical protein